MLEATILAALGLWLLAGATHRFRREVGASPGTRRLLRVAGTVLLLASAACSGTTINGEWCVRVLAAASIAGVALVLGLSVAPATLFAPIRRVIAARR